ncbi:tetratricopeptide repeat protein [uncultured Paraglaciecola sp.]|uniref:tetratricopeptide repeat protein n=1 Tax=uncultured Paraglaciecola sp. TaxID=1765024 RepID=UPI0026397FE0|nr:tetratricopeptide repeat protein [uncultured Paraglaciecola sp.]
MIDKFIQAPRLLALFLFISLFTLPIMAQQHSDKNTLDNAQQVPGLQEFIQARNYLYTDSAEQDNAKACELFLQAAKLGIPAAMQQTGHCYRDGHLQPIDNAIDWYQRAMAAGLAGAQCDIGALFFMGKVVEQDKAKGIRLCTLAAEVGAVYAKVALGKWYNQDEEIKDIQQAQHWLEQAAPYHAESAYLLAQLIENYSSQHEVALYWYETSASLGHLPAYQLVAEAYLLSMDKNQDKAEAFLAKAYIWSQAWQARVAPQSIPLWVDNIAQQTPSLWHQKLKMKVAEHLKKF